jgi:hypothetical protein
MPKKKKLYANMEKLLVKEAIDHLMFGYIICGRRTLPSVSLKHMMECSMEDFCLGEDDYPLDLAIQNWYRMFKEYVEFRNR